MDTIKIIYVTSKSNTVHVLMNDVKIASFNVTTFNYCCGTLNLENFQTIMSVPLTLKNEFKSVFEKFMLKYDKINIIFLDRENGDGEKLLGDIFDAVYEYKNPNSGNIVKLYSYMQDEDNFKYEHGIYDDDEYYDDDDDY